MCGGVWWCAWLLQAARAGQLGGVIALLERGCDINLQNLEHETALMAAVMAGKVRPLRTFARTLTPREPQDKPSLGRVHAFINIRHKLQVHIIQGSRCFYARQLLSRLPPPRVMATRRYGINSTSINPT